jgi:hypothetical protein
VKACPAEYSAKQMKLSIFSRSSAAGVLAMIRPQKRDPSIIGITKLFKARTIESRNAFLHGCRSN